MTTHSPKAADDLVPAGWPAPTPDERLRHDELTALIRREIDANGGSIAFARFMELALYAPRLGYYSGAQPKFGAHGDFITAPERSPLFGHCVANQVAQILGMLGNGDVLEAGAGSGALAAQLLLTLETLGQLPRRYLILELSAELRARQRQLLQQRAPHLLPRVQWLDTLPPPGFRGVVLGNELLDAMPVSRFHVAETGISEEHVCWDGSHLCFCQRPAGPILAAKVTLLSVTPDYVSEIGLQAEAWVRSMSTLLNEGMMLLIDYGFPQAEFYHPQRAQGTLMCHYRQRAHADPLMLVGLQDITAHVDFTAIAEAGHESGLEVLGYTSQAAFLIGCGLAEIAAEPVDARAQLLRSQEINKLTAPQEMGELFKVIALGRGVDGPLRGFVVQDRRSRL